MEGRPTPDPLPHSTEKAGGYPVTVNFPDARRIADAAIEITDPAGRAVPAWLSTPASPANPKYPGLQKATICAIAKGPLQPGTRYRVSARATVDGVSWRKAWSFRTQESDEAAAERESRLLLRCGNDRRRELGLGALVLDPRVSTACREHVRYLSYHFCSEPPVDPLKQDRARRHATPAGERIAPFSLRVNSDSGHHHVCTVLFGSPYTRDPLLDPQLRAFGVACDPLRPTTRAFVLYGVPSCLVRHVDPVVFPPPDATGVPLRSFNHSFYEHWDEAGTENAGYPFTVFFPPHRKVEVIGSVMYTGDGKEVECWHKTYPRALADGRVARVVILVPKAPLRPGTTYTAYVTASLDGRPWEHESKFTTGPAPPVPSPEAVQAQLLRSLNLHRRVAGLQPVTHSTALSAGCARHAQYLKANTHGAMRGT
jgi:hypothetical protein